MFPLFVYCLCALLMCSPDVYCSYVLVMFFRVMCTACVHCLSVLLICTAYVYSLCLLLVTAQAAGPAHVGAVPGVAEVSWRRRGVLQPLEEPRARVRRLGGLCVRRGQGRQHRCVQQGACMLPRAVAGDTRLPALLSTASPPFPAPLPSALAGGGVKDIADGRRWRQQQRRRQEQPRRFLADGRRWRQQQQHWRRQEQPRTHRGDRRLCRAGRRHAGGRRGRGAGRAVAPEGAAAPSPPGGADLDGERHGGGQLGRFGGAGRGPRRTE